mmetsp:Transcript_30348/g.65652  ORF Transcript_30348/g.65652 Transcript_30348/m.65652 type:complete len:230 (+) Transcript_30348:104-793(+)
MLSIGSVSPGLKPAGRPQRGRGGRGGTSRGGRGRGAAREREQRDKERRDVDAMAKLNHQLMVQLNSAQEQLTQSLADKQALNERLSALELTLIRHASGQLEDPEREVEMSSTRHNHSMGLPPPQPTTPPVDTTAAEFQMDAASPIESPRITSSIGRPSDNPPVPHNDPMAVPLATSSAPSHLRRLLHQVQGLSGDNSNSNTSDLARLRAELAEEIDRYRSQREDCRHTR